VFSALTILSLMRAQVVVLEQEAGAGAVASVVLRGSTAQLLDDLERALDDGVNTYKARPAHATPS
jgi:T-complex protein 1 subunit theta